MRGSIATNRPKYRFAHHGALLTTRLVAFLCASLLASTIRQIPVYAAPSQVLGPSPYSAPAVITTGSNGEMWFTELYGPQGHAGIARITTRGVVTEFRAGISAGFRPGSLALGPDGNVWFTENSEFPDFGGRIGRITDWGAVAEFNVSSGKRHLDSIVAGSDGAMWFTEDGSNRLGRVDMKGRISEIDLPDDVLPVTLVSGKSAIWFSEYRGDVIGRLHRNKTKTFTLPAGTKATVVTVTPTGAIWLAELPSPANRPNQFRISHMRMNGTYAPSRIARISACPGYIIRATDGNFWLTEPKTDRIARVTPDGEVKEFGAGIPHEAYPLSIVEGPDHALWFTELNISSIGRIALDGHVTQFPSGQKPTVNAKQPTIC